MTPSNRQWVFGDLLAQLLAEAGPAAERSGARPVTRRLCGRAGLPGPLSGAAGRLRQPAPVRHGQRQRPAFYPPTISMSLTTMTQVIAYCDSQAEFDRQAEALHADLVAYHQLYDIYNDYEGINNIKTINDNAGVAPSGWTSGSWICWSWPWRCTTHQRQAEHRHGQRAGHLARLPGGRRGRPLRRGQPAAHQEELEAAAQHCNIEDVIIDRQAGTVYLADPEMRLDVGSVGKGYAVEQVCQAARERGLVSLSLSVGGQPALGGVQAPGPALGRAASSAPGTTP